MIQHHIWKARIVPGSYRTSKWKVGVIFCCFGRCCIWATSYLVTKGQGVLMCFCHFVKMYLFSANFLQFCESLTEENKSRKTSPYIYIYRLQVTMIVEGNCIIIYLPIYQNGKNGKRNTQAGEATSVQLGFLTFLYQNINVYFGILGISTETNKNTCKSVMLLIFLFSNGSELCCPLT